MGKFMSITLKLPENIHTKLKVASALTNKSMTQIIVEFVEKMKVQTPDFMQSVEIKKTVSTKRAQTTKKPQVPNDELKEIILGLRDGGLSQGDIAKKLEADGIATARGGRWNRGTVAKMILRWDAAGKE